MSLKVTPEKKNADFAKYKEAHPETDPQPKDPEPPKADDNPEIAKLMERIAALEKDKEESSKKASIAQKRKDLTGKLKEKGVKDEDWLATLLSEVNIDENFDVEAKTESYLKLYNKFKANVGGSVPPDNPENGNPGSAYSNAIKEAAKLAKLERERANINK